MEGIRSLLWLSLRTGLYWQLEKVMEKSWFMMSNRSLSSSLTGCSTQVESMLLSSRQMELMPSVDLCESSVPTNLGFLLSLTSFRLSPFCSYVSVIPTLTSGLSPSRPRTLPSRTSMPMESMVFAG